MIIVYYFSIAISAGMLVLGFELSKNSGLIPFIAFSVLS